MSGSPRSCRAGPEARKAWRRLPKLPSVRAARANIAARVIARFGLDRSSWLTAATWIVAGGTAILGANALQPQPSADWWAWAGFWAVFVAAVALFGWGLLNGGAVFVRSGLFVWAFRRRLRFRSPVELLPDQSPPDTSIPSAGAVGVPTLVQEATESVLRRKWQEAEVQAVELRDRETQVHRALDTVLTWLYRRENWAGLSDDQRYRDSAPFDIWIKQKYEELDLPGMDYAPPKTVAAERGFIPPSTGAAEKAQTSRIAAARRKAEVARKSRRLQGETPAPLERADEVDTVPRLPRPPLAMNVPDDVWAIQHDAWCAARAGVLGSGERLVAELQELVHPEPDQQNRWDAAVRRWVQVEFHARVVDPYWGREARENVTSAAMAAGARYEAMALPPAWRQSAVAQVASRCAWLREQPQDCE